MCDVAGQLVVVVGLARVAVAEHVDRVTAEPGANVRNDVAAERLEVAARAVEEQHVLAFAGHERARLDTSRVDALDAERDRQQIGPDGHDSSPFRGASTTATAMPVFHSGTGAYESTRTGAWPHAAARISHVRTSLPPLPASSGSVRSRFGSAAHCSSAPRSAASRNARSNSGARRGSPPTTMPRRRASNSSQRPRPSSHEVTRNSSSALAGLRQSGNASACDSPPDAMSATRRSVAGEHAPERATECDAARQARERRRERVHEHRARSVPERRRACTAPRA